MACTTISSAERGFGRWSLVGVKAWPFVVRPAGEELDWDRDLRDSWIPAKNAMTLVLLGPGDLLIMPPGLNVAHAPGTVTDCWMTGAMLLDDRQFRPLLQHLLWVDQLGASKEDVPSGVIAILDDLWSNQEGAYGRTLWSRFLGTGDDEVALKALLRAVVRSVYFLSRSAA